MLALEFLGDKGMGSGKLHSFKDHGEADSDVAHNWFFVDVMAFRKAVAIEENVPEDPASFGASEEIGAPAGWFLVRHAKLVWDVVSKAHRCAAAKISMHVANAAIEKRNEIAAPWRVLLSGAEEHASVVSQVEPRLSLELIVPTLRLPAMPAFLRLFGERFGPDDAEIDL